MKNKNSKKKKTQLSIFQNKIFLSLMVSVLGLMGLIFLVQQKQILTQFAATTPDITVDFGSGQNHTYAIPKTFFGIGQLGNWQGLGRNTSVLSLLGDAGFSYSRVDVNFFYQFPNAINATNPSTVDWSDLDATVSFMQQGGISPLLILDYSPTWLADTSSGSCQSTQNYAPSNTTTWGSLAKQVVAHMDAKFPNVKPLYEIWNEPDGQFLCASDHLATWQNIFATAAPLMKQQGAADGKSIVVGGPALGQRAYNWIQAITTNPATAPYLDFISYHHYAIGTDQPDSWDGTYNGPSTVVLHDMQDPTIGITSSYIQMEKIVRAGKQPNAASTPIFITEYNANSGGPNTYNDCCNNQSPFAAIFNGLFVSDILNSVYQGATSIASGINYFHLSSEGGERWCMFGTIDAAMDCSTSGTNVPYPAYYPYQLLGSNMYLGMKQGGYLATATNTALANVAVSAFYTPDRESILLVNSSSTAYSGKTVFIQNPPGVSATANEYTITNQLPNSITTQAISLQQTTGGYLLSNISLPAYTVVGISLPYTPGALPTLTPTPGPCTGLVIATPLQLSKTSVTIGNTISGTVTYKNPCQTSFTTNFLTIASRDSSGGNKDFMPSISTTTLQPGQAITVQSSRTIAASDPTGQWYAFASYQDTSGNWHADTNNVYFTVAQPTPVQNLTATPTIGIPVTPTPNPVGVIAQDTFARANQSHWGTASDGHVWSSDAATNAIFTITSNTGQVKSGSTAYNAIIGTSATNAQVFFSGYISSFSNANIGSVLRWKDTNNWYKAYIDGANLVIQKKVNGTTTTVKSVAFKAAAGTSYTIRFQVVGTTLSAKVWPSATAEPTAWTATGTDTTFASGYCGLRMQVASGITATYTSFVATAL